MVSQDWALIGQSGLGYDWSVSTGPHRLPEVSRLVGVRGAELGEEDVEDVEEEEEVRGDAEEAREVGDPLHPALE